MNTRNNEIQPNPRQMKRKRGKNSCLAQMSHEEVLKKQRAAIKKHSEQQLCHIEQQLGNTLKIELSPKTQ